MLALKGELRKVEPKNNTRTGEQYFVCTILDEDGEQPTLHSVLSPKVLTKERVAAGIFIELRQYNGNTSMRYVGDCDLFGSAA
jgi:hypothetical protein